MAVSVAAGGGGRVGVLVVEMPATTATVLVAEAAAGAAAGACGVAVGGRVGVKVGRKPRVGSTVASDTCAGGPPWPNSAMPTQYPPSSAPITLTPIIAQRTQGRFPGSPLPMLMPLSPSPYLENRPTTPYGHKVRRG